MIPPASSVSRGARTGLARSSCASALALALLGPGCGRPQEPPPRTFALEQISPRDRELFLNHPLVLDFSEPVDPTSLSSESLRIAPSDGGRPARGAFRVEGRQVQFVPEPALAPDLSDGGFLPGERYEVLVRGFPRPDGIRSADGRPLACSYRWSFTTAPPSDSPRDLYRDRTLGYAEPLRVADGRLVGGQLEITCGPRGPIVLECSEPLDPASIDPADFTLHRLGPDPVAAVPFELELVENRDAGDVYARGTARLELRPKAPIEEGLYLLGFANSPRLTDLGGNTPPPWPRPIEVRVLSQVGEDVERFLDPTRRSPIPVPGADGTARWSDEGVVTIRFPRAAGDGVDGECVLTGSEARKDVHATRLVVPAGERCELDAPGLVVLRAQGSLRIEGELVRGGGGGPPVTWERGGQLSAWLARAAEQDPAWTVLVAGGDLVIDGALRTEGPLVLIAGGWIRASGVVEQEERQLWLLGEGGGPQLDPTRSQLDLELDPPTRNLLATELRFAVLSVPFPAQGRVESWLGAGAFGSSRGGSWRVRYVPFPDGDPLDALEDPRELAHPSQVRLLVELFMGPPDERGKGWAWSPPMVDEVHLRWEWEPVESEE